MVSVRDPRQNIFGQAYDALNRLKTITDERGAVTQLTRTGAGEVATHSDPNAVVTTYVRNGWGEAIREASPDIGVTDYVRDARGLVVRRTDGRGVAAEYAHDDAGRLAAVSYPGNTGENVAYSYDATSGGNAGIGRLTSVSDHSGSTRFTYDLQGRVVSTRVQVVGGAVYTTAYSWDAAGRVASITYPSGRVAAYAYDAAGRPTSVTTRRSAAEPEATLASAIAVRPFGGALTELRHGNGLSEWRGFDADGRVSAYGVRSAAAERLSKALSYEDGVNPNRVRDLLDPTKDEAYWYDGANRLQEATGPWGGLTFYTDGVGNRTHRIASTGTGTTTERVALAPGSNRVEAMTADGAVIRSFTHDAAGNLRTDVKSGATTLYTYNHAGRLSSVKLDGVTRGTYRTNAFGQVVVRVLAGAPPQNTVHGIYDVFGNLIAEADGSGVVLREYVWLRSGEGFRPLAVVRDVDTALPQVWHVHVDHLDRPVLMTDAARAAVWRATWLPFGEAWRISGPGSFDRRFPGQWFQAESGLHYNWHRHYDPSTGRYT